MKKDLRILKKLISYCFDTNFSLTILLILGSVILGLFSTIRVWILGKIVNQLSFEFSFLINILPFIIILGITLLMDEALFAFIPYFRRVLIIKIKLRMKKDLIYSINNIPPM